MSDDRSPIMAETYDIAEGDSVIQPRPPATPGAGGASGGDFCPRCGKPMGAAAVVCTACGLDLRTGETTSGKLDAFASPRLGDPAEAESADERPFLCAPETDGKWEIPKGVLVSTGLLLSLAGGVMAAVFLPGELKWWVRPARGLMVMLALPLHAGTGLIALYLAGLWLSMRVGDVERALTRLIAAVGLFLAISSVPLAMMGLGLFGSVLAIAFALVAYILGIKVLFAQPLATAWRITLLHGGVAIVIQLGLQVYHLVMAAAEAGK